MEKPKTKRGVRLAAASFAALAAAAALSAGVMVGCSQVTSSDEGAVDAQKAMEKTATVNYEADGRYLDSLAGFADAVNENLDAENAEENAPKSYVDRNGFTVQPVPSDGKGWNISYLNADNRGCTSCHTLEDALMMLDTYHGTIFMGYPTEQTYSTCVACHIWANPLRDSIHSTHLGSQLFEQDGGNCESCHYIDENGDFLRWDYEKYDLYQGITDVSADEAQVDVSYDQDTLTPNDKVFYKSIKEYGDFDAKDWRTDDSYMDPELYNNWVFTVDGDVENPISMTLPELVEKFGTEKAVMKQQCTINGAGNAAIMQSEVEGVPMKAIIDYVKPKSGVNSVEFLTEDPYPNVGAHYSIAFESMTANESLLVIKMNGETLPNTQGYPCSVWTSDGSAAGGVFKVCTGVNFNVVDDPDAVANGWYVGGFEDPYLDNAGADKPNSAVLNYPSGVVLEGVAGTVVNLEGFADAYDEPIEKIEFSWDHGQTWTTLETPNNDTTRWTYWRMNFTPPSEGAYLLDIRTTSIQPDGSERVSAQNTQFLLNVK